LEPLLGGPNFLGGLSFKLFLPKVRLYYFPLKITLERRPIPKLAPKKRGSFPLKGFIPPGFKIRRY